MSNESFLPPGARNQTDVFAVHGSDPEVLAYAMAKYSRSALSMRESLSEISAQRAEQFLNTFYFQYGHRSIADLAHIAFAVERRAFLTRKGAPATDRAAHDTALAEILTALAPRLAKYAEIGVIKPR